MDRKSDIGAQPMTRLGNDGFVLLAKAIVAAAIGFGLYLQFGFSFGVSATTALATYVALVVLHIRRARKLLVEDETEDEGSQRATYDFGSALRQEAAFDQPLRPQPAAEPPAAKAHAGGPEPGSMTTNKQAALAAAAAIRAQAQAQAQAQALANAQPQAASNQPPSRPVDLDQIRDDEAGQRAMQDFWTYRAQDVPPPIPAQHPPPGSPPLGWREYPAGTQPSPRLEQRIEPRSDLRQEARPEPRPEPVWPTIDPPARAEFPAMEPPRPTLREADVEMIQSLIKKLADEVNAADTVVRPERMADRTGGPVPANKTSEAVEASLDALRATAGSMRQAASRPAAQPPLAELRVRAPVEQAMRGPTGPAAPPPVRPGHLKLASVAEAVHDGRIEVLLEAIMGLGDLRARHFEVSIRLFDQTGQPIHSSIDDPALAGTNLLPLLDRALLASTASVSSRLEERGKSGSVFSSFSGEALSDRTFVAYAAESCRDRETLANQLVLTFPQRDVRMLSDAQWRGLRDLRGLGFRFAVGDVTDLDMDFERLAEIGFSFVKLDVGVFLDGLRSPHGVIPAHDICRYLSGLGFTLIAGRIDNEIERSRLFGFGVLFGQGQLFGGARPVKADALGRSRNAA